MKRLLFLLLFTYIGYSQQISYIIPDIAAPGMGTYLEIIGPAGSSNNFGTRFGLVLFDNQSVPKIELVNPTDSSKVTFGPLNFSWDGRLISTYIFVNPDVTPNTEYWYNLRPEFKIPFRVYLSATLGYTNIDTIYIVKPFDLGNISGNAERILGQGTLGVRSRKGAMIVKDVTLANAEYTISKNDCDPYKIGNQGYMPFILISTGKIQGGSNTVLNLNGVGKHAGPGGGGGGGRFCDGTFINPLIGEDGGDGFTAGGAGGRNNSAGTTNLFKLPGTGTGTNGSSINGIAPPNDSWYESSGGGTGHPFGSSGWSCGDGNNCDPPGGYGGGTGYRQNTRGGSGGFMNQGNQTGTDNGGKTVGNIFGIPISGGSGGASGNPNSPNQCSGNGGGGGGAIKLSANEIINLSISANGADGGTSSFGPGGAGSGGYIYTEGKTSTNGISASVKGGNNGLGGYGLIDNGSKNNSGFNFFPSNLTVTNTITTDSSKFVYKKFTLTGSSTGFTDSIYIYLKPASGIWRLIEVISGLTGKTIWSRDISLPKGDSIYYLFATLNNMYENNSQYHNQSWFVFNQGSSNLLIKMKQPEIAGDSIISNQISGCPTNSATLDAIIINNGDGPLLLNFQNSSFAKGLQGFQLISPVAQTNVRPNDTCHLKVKYTYQSGTYGNISDTLLIPHNDIFASSKPWKIAFNIKVDSLKFIITATNLNKKQDTFNFGKLCINDITTRAANVKNLSNVIINVSKIEAFGDNCFGITSSPFKDILANDKFSFSFSFSPKSKGTFKGGLIFKNIYCDAIRDTVYFTGEGIDAEFFVDKPLLTPIDTLKLGKVCVSDVLKSSFILRNTSGDDLTVNYPASITNAGYSFQLNGPNSILDKKWDTIEVTFTSATTGTISEQINFVSSSKCTGINKTLVMQAEVIKSLLSFTGLVNFGLVRVGDSDTNEIILKNNGTADTYIENLKSINSPFSIISTNPSLPKLLKPTEEIKIKLAFKPISEGNFSDLLEGIISLQPGTCPDSAKIQITGSGSNQKILASKDTVNFGLLDYCQVKEDTALVPNPTVSPIKLSNWRIQNNDIDYFVIAQAPASQNLNPKDTAIFIVKFVPKKGLDGVKISDLIIDTDILTQPELKVHLIGEQENLKVTASPNNINFGTVPIGVTKPLDITLTNTGKRNRQLIDVKCTNPDYSFTNTAGIITAGGGTFNVTATFKPSIADKEDADIEFIFRKDCFDTIPYKLFGTGKEGSVLATDKVDFLLSAPCLDVIDSIEVINTGASKITIVSMDISGTDASDFDFTNNITFPMILDSGKIYKRGVIFKGSRTGYGNKSAVITYRIYTGKKDTTIIQTILSGSRLNFVQVTPTVLNFPDGITGSSTPLQVTIKNVGSSQFKITKSFLPINATVFMLSPDPINSILLPGQSLSFNVSFIPSLVQQYNDQYRFEVTYTGCKDTLTIQMNGKGLPPLNALFWMEDITANPKAMTFNIPIYGKLNNKGLNVDKIELTGMISFNNTMYNPTGLTKGKLLLDSMGTDFRYIKFSLDSLTLTDTASVITELTGRPLLGNNDTTFLYWDSLVLSPKISYLFGSTDTLSGKLRSIICIEGGKRLLQHSLPLTMMINPNPADDKINLSITVLEIGIHQIDIINTAGERIYTNSFKINLDDEKIINKEINLSKLSSGMYYILLSSPTDRIAEPFFKIK